MWRGIVQSLVEGGTLGSHVVRYDLRKRIQRLRAGVQLCDASQACSLEIMLISCWSGTLMYYNMYGDRYFPRRYGNRVKSASVKAFQIQMLPKIHVMEDTDGDPSCFVCSCSVKYSMSS